MIGTIVVLGDENATLDIDVDTTITLSGGYAVLLADQDGSDVCLVGYPQTLRRVAVEILNAIPGKLFVPAGDGVVEAGGRKLSLSLLEKSDG